MRWVCAIDHLCFK